METKEDIIEKLLEKAELDFRCCGGGGRCGPDKEQLSEPSAS